MSRFSCPTARLMSSVSRLMSRLSRLSATFQFESGSPRRTAWFCDAWRDFMPRRERCNKLFLGSRRFYLGCKNRIVATLWSWKKNARFQSGRKGREKLFMGCVASTLVAKFVLASLYTRNPGNCWGDSRRHSQNLVSRGWNFVVKVHTYQISVAKLWSWHLSLGRESRGGSFWSRKTVNDANFRSRKSGHASVLLGESFHVKNFKWKSGEESRTSTRVALVHLVLVFVL